MSTQVSLRELLDAGVHFGHQTRRWNPAMRPFIFGERNGIHIIDLQKTQRLFTNALKYVEEEVAKGGHVLFIATKKQAQEVIIEEAERCKQFYVHHRWLGGMLTNYNTVRNSIKSLKKIEKMSEDGTYESLPKKEVILLEKKRSKLDRSLGGIKNMPGLPSAVFVIDPKKESTAIAEANRLGIPVIAVTDTNCNPKNIDYVIPGNDDSLKAIKLYAKLLADAVGEGAKRQKVRANNDDSIEGEGGRDVKVKRLKSREEKKSSKEEVAQTAETEGK